MRICVWPKSWSLFIRRPRALGERPLPRICDLHARNLDYMSAGHHALGLRCRKSSAHQLNHLIDRDTTCERDGLGAAAARCGKQGKRAVVVGPRVLLGHGSMYGVIEKIGKRDRLARNREQRTMQTAQRYVAAQLPRNSAKIEARGHDERVQRVDTSLWFEPHHEK
jgi:hypothetical protein